MHELNLQLGYKFMTKHIYMSHGIESQCSFCQHKSYVFINSTVWAEGWSHDRMLHEAELKGKGQH